MWLYFKFEVDVINVSKFQEFKNIEILSNKLSVIMTEITCTCFYLCGTLECWCEMQDMFLCYYECRLLLLPFQGTYFSGTGWATSRTINDCEEQEQCVWNFDAKSFWERLKKHKQQCKILQLLRHAVWES